MPTDSPCRRTTLTATHPESGAAALVTVDADGNVAPALVLEDFGLWHLYRPGYRPVELEVLEAGYQSADLSAAPGVRGTAGRTFGVCVYNVHGFLWEPAR